MKVYTRAQWGARPPQGQFAPNPTPTEMFVHHSAGQGLGIDSLAEQSACLRAIQAYHLDVKDWSDVGYHLVVFQPYGRLRRARVFEGRPVTAVPAAQLNHNTGTLAVCVVGDRERIKGSTKRLLKRIYRESSCSVARGHFEVVSTSCPGLELRRFLPELRGSK